MALTDRDIDKLSTALAGKLHAQCPLGLTTEDIAAIRYVVDLLKKWSACKWKVITAVIILTFAAALGLMAKGFGLK